MPTIRLATDEDLRAITSRYVAEILKLPHLYIPTDEPDVMRSWGVARSDGDASVAWYAKRHPGAVVAPTFAGGMASRGDLLYHGAEAAEEFVVP